MLKVSADSVNSNRFGLALYQGESVDENNPLRLKWFSPSRLCHYKRFFSNTGQDRSQFTITAVPFKTGTADLSPGEILRPPHH